MSALDELDIYVPLAVVDIVHSLEAEIERLHADNQAAVAAYAAEITEAKAESERLREELATAQQDAERYRWMRNREIIDWDCLSELYLREYEHPDSVINSNALMLDSAIDAAMGKQNG